jgi:hypothetical protein
MRVAMKLFAIECLMCALAACSPQATLDRATLQAIAAETTALLDTESTSKDISVTNLPTAIQALNPERSGPILTGCTSRPVRYSCGSGAISYPGTRQR